MTDSTDHRSVTQPRRLHFLMLPQVHLLDLAGPAQVFYEANGLGADYKIQFCSVEPRVPTAQGLWLADPLEELSTVAGNLLHNPDLTLEGIATYCGFQDPRQLRRLWKESYGVSPSAWRSQQEARS